MYRIDLHTHSQASPDGALRPADYATMLESGGLHSIAISDHNRVDFAQEMQKMHGGRIIVGEEITTAGGEIIGLYLTEVVPAGMTATETVRAIKAQGGLVYVPHPFETVRKGLRVADLDEIGEFVDIVETRNGRAVFENKSREAAAWAAGRHKAAAASSDAHGRRGWGRTYSEVAQVPTRETLVSLLADSEAKRVYAWIGPVGLAYPKLNRLRKGRRRDA
jgi:predicted metal-dependent phosphoesterase TrpH